MYATREYIQLLASGLADQNGITIREGKGWSTDLEKKIITYVMNDLNNKPFGAVRGLLLHEVGHIKYTQILKVPDNHVYTKKYGDKIMGGVYNCFEDWRIERLLVNEYGAYARGAILEMNYTAVYQALVETNASFLHLPKYHQFLMIASYSHLTWVHNELSNLIGHGAEFFINPRLRQYYGFGLDAEAGKALEDSMSLRNDLTLEIIQAKDVREVRQIVDAKVMPILEKLLDNDPKAQQQQQQNQQQQQGGGSVTVQMQSGGSQSQQQDSGDQSAQAGGGKPEKKEDKQPEKPEQKAQGGGSSKQEDKKDAEEKEEKAGAGEGQEKEEKQNNNKDQSQKDTQPAPSEPEEKEEPQHIEVEISVVGSLKNSNDEPELKAENVQLRSHLAGRGKGSIIGFTKPTVREASTLLKPYSITLANRLLSILKEREATRWTGNHLTGRLLGKNAYKVMVKDESRIFSRRSNPNHPKYAVHIAIDGSGSMRGERATFAFMGAVLLEDVCKTLGFDVHLYRYDEDCRELKTMDDYKSTGGGTYDQSALEKINKSLTQDGEKLIFMVTDGDTSRDRNYAKLERDLIAKNVTLIGIGIGNGVSESTMKSHYPVGIHVPKVEELPMVLINTMRQIIHR